MIGFLFLIVLVSGIGVLIARKRKRARDLSGTVAARPVFMVDPPRRRLTPRKEERL